MLRLLVQRIRQGLSLLGRWSLTFYMVHQPVLDRCACSAWMTLQGPPLDLDLTD
jgi:peptidoglycan/LPS O-acetylase OafA/YrhL